MKGVTREELVKNHIIDKKAKKFFRVVVPLLVIELLILAALVTVIIMMPNNRCKIEVNNKDAVFYVNDKKTNKFRMDVTEETTQCHYAVDVEILLPEGRDYKVSYTVSSSECIVYAVTDSSNVSNTYSLEVKGGVKTRILSGLILYSNKPIEKFNIKIDVVVSNVWL